MVFGWNPLVSDPQISNSKICQKEIQKQIYNLTGQIKSIRGESHIDFRFQCGIMTQTR